MFQRHVEIHQAEAFEGVEAARQYAESTRKSTRRYMAFYGFCRHPPAGGSKTSVVMFNNWQKASLFS